MKKKQWIIVGLALASITAIIIGFLVWKYYFSSKPGEKRPESETGCNNIDSSSWQIYDKQGFSVKYPQDWFYKEEKSEPAAIQWYVSFGPNNRSSVVWIGGTALNLAGFKNELTNNLIPGFDIENEEKATIDSKEGTKLTVHGKSASYKSYIYFVPFLEVPYVFQGPADLSSEHFEMCEPQIYLEMIKTFKFPQMQEEVPSNNGQNPTVASLNNIKRYTEEPWKFQFSKDMNESTIKKENLNLYAVGLSLGSQGTKSLSNSVMDKWVFNYDSNNNILTITISDWEPMVCASCVWELEFTEKIKDKNGMTLVKKSFEQI